MRVWDTSTDEIRQDKAVQDNSTRQEQDSTRKYRIKQPRDDL